MEALLKERLGQCNNIYIVALFCREFAAQISGKKVHASFIFHSR